MHFRIKTLAMIGCIAIATAYVFSRSTESSAESLFSIITSLVIPPSIPSIPSSPPACRVLVAGPRFLFFKSIRDFFIYELIKKFFFVQNFEY